MTAHPYGVNTPGGFLMVFSLVYPLTIKYLAAPDQGGEMDCVDGQCTKGVKEQVEKVWQGAVASNMVVGLISCAGAFAGPWIVRNVPLPALLTPTMGVGLMFLAVWKSNFGRPTPSTRCYLRSCVLSLIHISEPTRP